MHDYTKLNRSTYTSLAVDVIFSDSLLCSMSDSHWYLLKLCMITHKRDIHVLTLKTNNFLIVVFLYMRIADFYFRNNGGKCQN